MFEGIVTLEGAFSDEQMEFAKQCRLIMNETYTKTVIRFVEGMEEPELYVLLTSSPFYKLLLDFEGFIEMLYENMGMLDWQRFLLDSTEFSDEKLAYTSHPAVKFIQDMFPEADLSNYRMLPENELK